MYQNQIFKMSFNLQTVRDVVLVSTSWSRDPWRPRPRSHLRRIGKRLGLGIGTECLGLGIGLGQLGLGTSLQNALMWPQYF